MDDYQKVFKNIKTIAVVGLSDKSDRPSFEVATYLQNQGYKIIPVNPMIMAWKGIKSYPSIKSIPTEVQIDVVDIFRKSEEVLKVVDEVIQTGKKPLIWMQEGVVSLVALKKAQEFGMEVVMGECMLKKHKQYIG